MALPNMDFWSWLVHTGLIQGDPSYYSSGKASPAEYDHALQVAVAGLATASDPRVVPTFWEYLVSTGAIQGDPSYYSSGQAQPFEVTHAISTATQFFTSQPAGTVGGTGGTVTAGPITDVPPVQVGSTLIPNGARLVRVTNPLGSDAAELFYLIYDWRGVQLSYEVGDRARLTDLFGGPDAFNSYTTVTQAGYDNAGYTGVGSADQILGQNESLGSQIEREIRALGLEDLPAWLSGSPQALELVAQATAQEWSSGRLWTELSTTAAFGQRFGSVIDLYKGSGSIASAVDQIVADEEAFARVLRTVAPELAGDVDYVHSLLNQGWTATAAGQVLMAADTLRRDPQMLDQANAILEMSGLGSIDEVGFVNALQGHGPADVIEALNTAAAGQALMDAGLGDVNIDLLMSVVDTSDRLLTADSFRELTQQLAFNLFRFDPELKTGDLGISEEDLVAAAFGRESPSGKTAGETLNLLARFERDRQAAGTGFDQSSGFLDQRGRLVVQGLSGLGS